MKRMHKLLAVILIVLVVAAIIGGFLALKKHREVFSSAISKQVSFLIIYPTDQTAGFTMDKATQSYDSSSGVLSFVMKRTRGSGKIIFSEQATPDNFTDIPASYDKLLEKLHQYQMIDGANGKVALTRPEELKGVQVAVINSKGTLIFARAEPDVSADDWRRIFNTAQTISGSKP